jgi:hypothetical protein
MLIGLEAPFTRMGWAQLASHRVTYDYQIKIQKRHQGNIQNIIEFFCSSSTSSSSTSSMSRSSCLSLVFHCTEEYNS